MLTAFLGFRFVPFPSCSNLSLSLPSAMFGEMAADSSMGMGMGMSFHQGVATSTTLYHHHHHHMLSFQSNPDSSPTGAAIISPTTIITSAAGPAPAPAHGLGPNIAGLFLPSPNTPMLANVASSSSLHGVPSTPKCKFVTGSPADWTTHEFAVLKEGLIRYAHEPNIMKYIKIAAMLPTRTIRDVALRCWWTTGKESRRRKPDEFYAGKKISDLKEKMAASTSVANFQMAPLNNVAPFSISMHHAGQNSLVPKEVPVLDNATQHLLEENNQLLSEIAANIETSKMEENMDLFLRTNNNIRTISKRMRETPGIMGQMPPLPVPVNEDHLNLLLQLDSASDSFLGTVLEGVYTAEIRLDCRT